MRNEDLPSSLRSRYAPLSRPPARERPLHVILAATGSVASVKTREIVHTLLKTFEHVRVFVIVTKTSKHFVDIETLPQYATSFTQSGTLTSSSYTVRQLAAENEQGRDFIEQDTPRLHIWDDQQDWADWKQVGDPVLHIELRRWADVVLVAPCSANTLAKIHAGLCDNLLTNMLRALSPSTPTLLFPAMNTLMYLHPLTSVHTAFARDVLGYKIIGPISKKLACGDVGQGAMTEWFDIVGKVVELFGLEAKR